MVLMTSGGEHVSQTSAGSQWLGCEVYCLQHEGESYFWTIIWFSMTCSKKILVVNSYVPYYLII
jgi:hypothetical protein